jgi:predicted amidohydrolase YtcJ
MAELAGAIERGAAAGLPVAIHAIGDRAVRELLDVFSEVLPKSQSPNHPINHSPIPHRIEHVQHSHPDDLRRLGSLGLVASVQPIHQVDDMALVERALGGDAAPHSGDRGRWSYAWRTLLDSGAVLALGSDCPVASPNPFWGIHAAVTRQRRDGTPPGGWYAEQRLSVAEAVAGYTLGPAYASGQLDAQGSITPGKLADLVVLDRDIFAVAPHEIADIRPVMTIFDGDVVYDGR